MHYTLSSLRKKENGSCPRQEMWKRRVGKVNSDTGGREIQWKSSRFKSVKPTSRQFVSLPNWLFRTSRQRRGELTRAVSPPTSSLRVPGFLFLENWNATFTIISFAVCAPPTTPPPEPSPTLRAKNKGEGAEKAAKRKRSQGCPLAWATPGPVACCLLGFQPVLPKRRTPGAPGRQDASGRPSRPCPTMRPGPPLLHGVGPGCPGKKSVGASASPRPGPASCPPPPGRCRSPYPQDVVAFRAPARDLDALRGAHGGGRSV